MAKQIDITGLYDPFSDSHITIIKLDNKDVRFKELTHEDKTMLYDYINKLKNLMFKEL